MTTKKNKSKIAKTATKAPKSKATTSPSMFDAALASICEGMPLMPTAGERRRELLARVAGTVAAGLVTAPTPSIATPSGLATVAVDIAEEILKKAGISTEPRASADAADALVDGAHGADVRRKVLGFLTTEWERTESRQLVGVDLLYIAGQGFRDVELRRWERANEPEFFAERSNLEMLAAAIVGIAEGELETLPTGKNRFVVRTRQYIGDTRVMSFALYQHSYGAAS